MSRAPKAVKRLVIAGVAILALVAALHLPATTKQGVNFQVSTYRIPLYVKVIDFLYRDAKYKLLAREATRGCSTDEEKVLAAFAWTRANIRPTPGGWPAVDDHILHIIIRGYGLEDQMADVFTTLTTYAGVPGFWKPLRVPDASGVLILAFAKIGDRWAVFDVSRGLMFRDRQGRFLDARALAADPKLVFLTPKVPSIRGTPYAKFVERLDPFTVPPVLRAEQQMPISRLALEVRELFQRLMPAHANAAPRVSRALEDDP